MARLAARNFEDQLLIAGVALRDANGFEAALSLLNTLSQQALGDPEAAFRPGMLREGERDYRVAGTFLVTPDRRYNMLCGNVGFPAEQRRLMIPIGWNDPGWVVANEKPLLIPNTDRHQQFRQFLKSSRMGSSIYAPIFARIEGAIALVGQMVAAAQARETYDETDLARLRLIAMLAGQAHGLHDGAHWLAADYPAADAWRADAHAPLGAQGAESPKG
jgi:GAF domain